MNIVLPTSQVDKHYYNNPDNMRDTVVIEINESEYFYKKTLIDLKTIIYERRATIEEAWDAGYLKYQGKLESHLFDRIENTIRNSIMLSLVEKKEFLCEE